MASARKETERTKFIQDKCLTLLTQMLRDEDNKYCVDCDSKGPRWASWNLGVFLCIRCAGIHRNLGVHISRVRSVNLDTWTPEQVMSLQNMGNSRARAIYEAQLPDGFRRPQTDASLESFVRAKYEHKKYMAREYVPSTPAVVNWDKEIDEEMERQKRSKKKTTTGLGPLPTDKKPTSTKSSVPIALTKPTQSPKLSRTVPAASVPVAPVVSSGSADLLGLGSPVSSSATSSSSPSSTNGTKSEAAEVVGDIFSSFFSAPTKPVTAATTVTHSTAALGNPANVSLAKQEEDFFNQVAPTEQEKGKMTRDSIMALYAKTTTPSTNVGQFNGVGAGFNQINGQHGFMVHQQTQQLPSQIGGFTNAQLLGQLGSTAPPSSFGLNGQQSQASFGHFGSPSVPQQPQTQNMQSFAHFPPMGAAVAPSGSAGFPLNNGFGSQQSAGTANTASGINQQFANLNMWQ